MPEIYLGKINRAEVKQRPDGGRDVSVYLIDNAATPMEVIRTPTSQPPHVWLAYDKELREKGEASIASPEYPITTPSGGAISVFYMNGKSSYVSFSQKLEGKNLLPPEVLAA